MALTFQAVCWRGEDIVLVDDDEDEDIERKQFKIFIFGKTADGTSICCIADFYPYFYVSLPRGYSRSDAVLLRDSLIAKLGRTFRGDVVTEACTTVTRKKFYGFTAGEPTLFLRMVFRTRHAFAVANKVFAEHLQSGMALYESNVDPVLKLLHCRNLESAGWIRVESWTVPSADRLLTECTREICARYDALVPGRHDAERGSVALGTERGSAPLVLASFDIESYSHDGGFPNPDEEGNEVIQIATVFQRYGEPRPYKRVVLCLGDTVFPDLTAPVVLRCFDRESDLLVAWTDLIRAEHADVLIGYNIWGFDMEYIYKRAMFHFELLRCGKMRGTQSALRKTVLSSSAYGHNEFLVLETPGILQIDLLHVLRKEHKLESYSLNNVSKHFLKDAKVDLPIKKMFELYRGGSPTDRGIIAEYCLKDAELPLRIMDTLSVMPNMIEMAKATHVPLEFLIPRGQQIKVFSQILKRLRDRGYLCPTDPVIGGGAEYTGATVLEPLRGAYMTDVITGLDFASLYPTIMRAHRLCHSTIVLDRRYADLPGVVYETLDVEGRQHTFAQTEDAILPELLKDLAEFRKAAKKNMAAAKARGDDFMASVYNGQQMAYKISMNSIYGFCGAANGFLPCPPIAAAVTSIGREMILRTKAFVEETYPGSTVVYGDSVMPYTPIFVKHAATGEVRIRRIEDLFSSSAEYAGFRIWDDTATEKQRCDVRDLLAWTHLGWQPIRRVIRHRSSKKIYRVVSHTAVVDVTEDHSLLDPDGRLLKPTDVVVGSTRLLRGLPPACDLECLIDETGQYSLFDRDTKEDSRVTAIRVLHDSWDGFVYDLETEAGSFQAGIGDLIVKNTDSVMVKFATNDMHECFRLGQEAADAITAVFKKPIQLEFEKCYSPYFLFSKKRYCGLMYTTPDAPDYIDAKGIQLVRRDNCPLVRSVSRTVLDTLMYRRDVEAAIAAVREAALKLLRHEVDVQELVLSKTLKPEKSYKNPNQPHVHVARNIERRNGMAGSGPKSGERVPYVFVQSEDPQALQYTKAEDPAYVAEADLRVDVLYYLEHQLESPMIALFELLLDDPHATLFADIKETYVAERKRAITEYKRRSKLKRDKQREITDFFSAPKSIL